MPYTFNTLMYADDLIIFSTSTKGLQDSLNSLSSYCAKWKLDINYTKTKCMSFTKGTQKEKHIFKIKDKVIENVKDFKYLGITINRKNGTFTPTLSDLSIKASRALYAIYSRVPFKRIATRTMLKLFETCIIPILLYGSEVWAPYMNYSYTKWEYTPIEKIHSQFLKRILGVNRSTTNILARAEFGRNPLMAQILTRNMNYIKYLENKDETALVKQAFNLELTKSNSRTTICQLPIEHKASLEHHINTNDILRVNKVKQSKAIFEVFNTLWLQQIPLYTKSNTYHTFKDRLKFEDYLVQITDRKLRVIYTKFRLSDHSLFIEEGRRRRPKVPRELRICELCSQGIEDETHFLLICNKLHQMREDFLESITSKIPSFSRLTNQQKFITSCHKKIT